LKENDDKTGKKTNEAFSCERQDKPTAHATTASLRDLRAHLTNVALNKTDEKYNDKNAQKFDLRALRLSLNGRFGEDAVDTLFRDIQNVVVKSVLACAPKFRKTSFAAGGDYLVENCFETYGFDVLIDDGLKPWLVEVNAAPSFVADTPSDAALKKKVVSDVLDVLDMESVVMERYGGGHRAVTRTKTVGGFDLLWDDGPVASSGARTKSNLGFFVEGL
jgi:hypothetical protein